MRHLLKIIFLICFSITTYAQTTNNKQALELYKQGIELHKSGESRKAINILKKAIDLDKKFADARCKLAEVYLGFDNAALRQRGETEFNKLIKEYPGKFEYKLSLGKSYLHKNYLGVGLYNFARGYFENLLKEYPDSTSVLEVLGDIYTYDFNTHKDMYALGAWGMAPFYDDNLYGLQPDFNRSSQSFKDFKQDRRDAESFGLSFEEFAEKDYKKAVSTLNKIAEVNPGHRDTNFKLGVLAYDKNDMETFIAQQKKILEKYPRDKNANLYMGLGMHVTGESNEAIKYFDRAKKLMDKNEKEVFDLSSIEYICPLAVFHPGISMC